MLRSRHRPTCSRRELHLRLRRFLRLDARMLAALALAQGTVLAALALVLDGYLLGLLQGVAASGLVASACLLFLSSADRAPSPLAGGWGESSTRDVLGGARRRGHIEGWVDGLEIEHGDVDHLVVTPSAILAIDSTWRGRRLSPHMLEADVRAAASSARRASSILRSLHRPATVTPVVVVWGGGRELLGRGRTIRGIHVVAGPHLRGWLREHACRDAAPLEEASSLLGDLRAFRQRVQPPRPDDRVRAG